jgi:hypothetical protein
MDDDCDGQTDEGNVCGSPVLISISDVSVTEGNKGQKTMTFKVTLNKKSPKTITVAFSTTNGSATAPGDYGSKSGTVNFAPRTKKKSIGITIKGDRQKEPNETFTVNLSNPVNAGIADGTGIGTILNDDGTTATQPVTHANNNTINRSVKVTPNPAQSVLYVLLYGYTGPVTIQLYSEEGKVLKQQKVQSAFIKYTRQQLNVSDIASGVYFLTVIDEKGNRQTQKVIVAR